MLQLPILTLFPPVSDTASIQQELNDFTGVFCRVERWDYHIKAMGWKCSVYQLRWRSWLASKLSVPDFAVWLLNIRIISQFDYKKNAWIGYSSLSKDWQWWQTRRQSWDLSPISRPLAALAWSLVCVLPCQTVPASCHTLLQPSSQPAAQPLCSSRADGCVLPGLMLAAPEVLETALATCRQANTKVPWLDYIVEA